AKLPDHLQPKHFPNVAGGPPDQFLEDHYPMVRLTRTHYKWLASSRTLLTAIAAERFRIACGHWPDSVTRLVPEFLDTVPPDPYDGKPIRMRQFTNGLTIYSIGSSLSIRLWNPDKRRQLPGHLL